VKQIILRIPNALKVEAILLFLQASASNTLGAISAAKRNRLRNGFTDAQVNEADLRAAVELIRMATTCALAEISAPASGLNSGSTALCEVTKIDEAGNDR
jgi:hypothetical protein